MQGFPEFDRNAHGLRRLPVAERLGLIWLVADPTVEDVDFDAYVAPLRKDFGWFAMEQMRVAARDTIERAANWKLQIEGGIEAYHFKIAHRSTIGPHFLDNLSSYAMLGSHMRSILPRTSLPELTEVPQEDWSIRTQANVLYTVFPTNQFLLMQDHVAWLQFRPLAADRTHIQMTTLALKEDVTPARQEHWRRNHEITRVTLFEDFEINEQIQEGLNTGANANLTFGRFEGALDQFNASVEALLSVNKITPDSLDTTRGKL